MRRAARLVAPILIVFTAIGEPFAMSAVHRWLATPCRSGMLDAAPVSTVAEIGTEASAYHVISTTRAARGDSNAIGASPIDGESLRSLGRLGAAADPFCIDALGLESGHGRAPPLPC